MSDHEVVEALVDLLPDGWAVTTETPDGRPRGRCIETARLVCDVLGRAQVAARAVACDVICANALAAAKLRAGGEVTDGSDGAWTIGAKVENHQGGGASLDEPYRRRGYGGHVIVVGDDWFLDATVAQFARPDKGIVIDGAVLGPYDPADTWITATDDGSGTVITWRLRPEVRAWRTTPAWRQDFPAEVVSALAGRLRAAVG